jgi:hypothetical protein
MVFKDLIISDNPDTPSSKYDYLHWKGQIQIISDFRDTFQDWRTSNSLRADVLPAP